MSKRKTWIYLQGCTLAVLLGVPILAEPASTESGAVTQPSNEFAQARKKWRRGSFFCGKCDEPTTLASVTVFELPNGRGKMQGFGEGKFYATALNEVGDDTISSLRVETGYTAKLCANNNGGGACRDFQDGEHNVPAELDNKTSFMWVKKL